MSFNKAEFTNGSANGSNKGDDYALICRQNRQPKPVYRGRGHNTSFNSDVSNNSLQVPGFGSSTVPYFDGEEIDCFTDEFTIKFEEPFFTGISWT
jgi:hypothetical protein